jgi:hypothetical protein
MTANQDHQAGPHLYVREIGKLQAIDAVLKSRHLNQTEALILIGLIVRSDGKYANAYPGGGTLAVYAKVADTRPVFKALKRLEDSFEVIERKSRGDGRSNSYTVLPQRIINQIVAEYDARKRATHCSEGGGLEAESHSSGRGGLDKKPTASEEVSVKTHHYRGGATHLSKRGTYPFHNHSKEREAPAHDFVPADWSRGEDQPPKIATPHMNGRGFVISDEHDLMIPMKTVESWRDRFPHLPDLEAKMTKLGVHILHKGRAHEGWASPEGWMVGLLADDNQKAKSARDKETANRPARTFKR